MLGLCSRLHIFYVCVPGFTYFTSVFQASLSVGIDAILNSTGKVVALENENQTNDNEMFKLAVDDFLSPKEFKVFYQDKNFVRQTDCTLSL